jgi:regulator of sigma E protease
MSVTAILLFVLILLVLVVVHEFGHFIIAKLTGMQVDEFAFGFPPRMFAKKYGETVYAFNIIPLGGYVSILGENGGDDEKKKQEALHNKRAFGNRPWWAQLLVLVAGVTMNMILAVLIFIGISYGKIQMSADDPVYGSRVQDSVLMVSEVSKDSPAHLAGIVPGSVILKVSAGRTPAVLTTATSLITFIGNNQNSPFAINYRTPDGYEKSTVVAAVYGIVPEKKALGIALEAVGTVKTTFPEAIVIGYNKTVNITEMTVGGLVDVLSQAFHGKSVLSSLSGPVGIAKIVGETSTYGYVAVLTLVAVLSINLAIFNILPLPALDGGRIVVVLFETISRRKVPYKYYSWVNVIGFGLLMLLLVVVTFNDIRGY